MWARKMCSLSTHDETCLLPRRSPSRAPHLLTSNPRRTLPCTPEKPLAASPPLLTFNPRRSAHRGADRCIGGVPSEVDADAVAPRDALESGDEGPLRERDEGRHGAGMGTKRATAPTRRLEPALQRYQSFAHFSPTDPRQSVGRPRQEREVPCRSGHFPPRSKVVKWAILAKEKCPSRIGSLSTPK